MEEPVFKRDMFRRFPWLNLVMTIIVTILQFAVAIFDFYKGQYFFTVVFIIFGLVYLFLMIPTSYNIMERTIASNKRLDDLEKRIKEERRKFNENISKL